MPSFDYLVIGSGSAGLTFALNAAKYGTVAVITKKDRTDSSTNWAQGGIAGVIGPDDLPELHVEDTLIAGAGLCSVEAVNILVHEGPRRIEELMEFGARFNHDPSGALSLGREGGHSRRRIVHSADLTGREVERALVESVRLHPQIAVFEHHCAIDLIVKEGKCHGAYVLDEAGPIVESYSARATLLATGGCGQIYQHTTNPSIATGDGVAIAWRAGCAVANMEFIQFHPTSLYHPSANSFLISEAVRGEGAILRRHDGAAFMEKYDERRELAPRDIVARAIDSEMKTQGIPCVYLDITGKPGAEIRAHFPNIYARCLTFGIDITSDWIPVVPAAHYSCGGVVTDLAGRTTLPGLYACGETACTGVHGANRLASNSLLEALVFAHRAAEDVIANSPEFSNTALPSFSADRIVGNGALCREPALRDRLKIVMQKYVGIVRSNQRLQNAQDAIDALVSEAAGLFSDGKISGDRLEMRNLLDVAQLIVRSARGRHESRGLHYTTDYPEALESERHDTVLVPGNPSSAVS
jgi:L-aspartate oxidase